MEHTFEKWISDLSSHGLLCAEYMGKVHDAGSNRQLVDIVMDANGMSYLPEMAGKGVPLPYEVITSRFAPFINGRYIGRTVNKNGHEYTSALYCRYEGVISNADITLLTLLGCDCKVEVAPNSFIHIYIDSRCKVHVDCPVSSRAIVESWNGAVVDVTGDVKRIEHG